MDNEGANTELRSWCAHLSSPAAASGRTSSQGVSQVGATEPADLQQCFPKTLVFPRLCLGIFSYSFPRLGEVLSWMGGSILR